MEVEIAVSGRVIKVTDVTFALFNGYEGKIGVLPHHAPMVTLLQPGKLRLSKVDGQLHYMVGKGVVQVSQDVVRIVADNLEVL